MSALIFSPVQTRRTFEEAVEQIAERIQLGELRVGDQLPPERALAAQMQISRPTVREALKILADSGVIEVRPGPTGGAFVRSEFVPREVIQRRSDLRLHEVGGVLEARRLLEPRVAQLAAVHGTEPDFEAMERTIALQVKLAESAGSELIAHEDRFLGLDQRFHLAIARATGNSTIVGLMRTLLRRLDIARDMAMHEPPTVEWSLDIHRQTVDAIRSGDMARIEVVMDEHLAELERAWERDLDPMRPGIRDLPHALRPAAGAP
ncbi:FCD domain-containing protein [Paraconexibacter antarcticus]|uniref:FCD domain-containing protein n=1 Tax=Paraconexibacter antarcticus TaxID=2949664 RepID=A0ABY5DUH1_9ACTN|nr:FCD domain-containing protein [Paraconexibacter antarcticus]UTI65648.1 FCD domain-containing protein [Paraconexibacter antarcticus]